jgi:GNAT superfamily N-acetyltransferase
MRIDSKVGTVQSNLDASFNKIPCISDTPLDVELVIDFQLWYYQRCYRRRDQDAVRYAAYLSSEEELEKRYGTLLSVPSQFNSYRYHDGVFLYLDNICVDFRVARSGVGTRLLEWGIQEAAALQVPIKTETTGNNVQFYENSGFRNIGQWTVNGFQQATGMSLHVMQRDLHLNCSGVLPGSASDGEYLENNLP